MRYILILILSMLSSCNTPRHVTPPNLGYEQEWHTSVEEKGSNDYWWRELNDPVLTKLIECGTEQNLDLKIAEERIHEWIAERKRARSALLPQLSISDLTSRNRFSENSPQGVGQLITAGVANAYEFVYSLGGILAWELDIFGERMLTMHAAGNKIFSHEAQALAVRSATRSRIAITYMQLRDLQRQKNIYIERLNLFKELVSTINTKVNVGILKKAEGFSIDSDLQAAYEQLPLLDAQIRSLIYELSLLIGEPPEYLLCLEDAHENTFSLPGYSAGLRSELLCHRPDILAAEYDLAAATQLKQAAVRTLFPKILLFGTYSYLSTHLDNLFDHPSSSWALGEYTRMPLYTGGRIRAEIDKEGSRQNQAYYNYKKTVLNAFKEAEEALHNYNQYREALTSIEKAANSTHKVLIETENLYKAGLISKEKLLEISITYNSRQAELLSSQLRAQTAYISLQHSLGN